MRKRLRCRAILAAAAALMLAPSSIAETLPPVMEMAINLKGNVRNASCAPCTADHPLGPRCCGMCGFWENWRHKNSSEPQPWVAPCSLHGVGRLVQDLKDRGIDLHAFQPDDLFSIIRGRTLWLIGDSQTGHWYDAVECFLSSFLTAAPRTPPLADTSSNLWLMDLDDRMPRKGASAAPPQPAICALYQDNTRVCSVRVTYASDLAHPALRVLQRQVPNLHRDVAVVSAGLHYGINANEQYSADLRYFTEYAREERDALPLLIWKDVPPQHFEYDRGYYWWADGSKKGVLGNGKHEHCRPLTEEELGSDEIRAGGWYNSVATPVIRAAGIPIFDVYNETLPLWQFHIWDKDCTHYCHPGPYEVWTFMLANMLRTLKLRD